LRLFSASLGDEPIWAVRAQLRDFDPVLGWANRPGSSGAHVTKEFSYHARVNSHGLRGPEIDVRKPAGTRRIALLGDSFAWGRGVEESDTFAALIERGIDRSQVLNFGVVGYAPVQTMLLTDKVLSFDPDVVVLAFCLGNDFADNVFWRRYGYYKPYAKLDETGALVVEGYPIPQVSTYPTAFESKTARLLQDHLYLFRLVDRATINTRSHLSGRRQEGPAFSSSQADLYTNPHSPVVDLVIRINSQVMRRLVHGYTSRGIPVIVVAAPSKCELGACFGKEPGHTDAAIAALRRSLDGLPVTLVDPTPSFAISDFWTTDAHWRPSGHRKVADALVPVVAAELEEQDRRH